MCVLKAASDVWARMFEQPMNEQAQGIVSLPDVRRVPLRVFLRLIYTSHVDSSDWLDGTTGRAKVVSAAKVLRQSQVTVSVCFYF